jgi:lysophosphatidylcholine acyltransferase/lyso-PAF acetyltransferase
VALSLLGSERRGEDDPIPASRQRIIKRATIFWSRLLLFGAGFFWIREQGPADPNAAVIVCNHTSWVDILYYMTTEEFPSFLANDGLRRMPCMGKIAQGVQCLFVNRADKTDRSLALSKVENRQNAIYARKGFPKLLLFPEGTTTNGSGLLFFRKGAFVTGVPVQPVGLQYSYSHYSPAMDSIPMFPQVVLLCCQLYNSLSVTRLPTVYRGSLSPEEYAQQVREVLAAHLQVPLLPDRFEDKFEFLEIAFGKKIKHS